MAQQKAWQTLSLSILLATGCGSASPDSERAADMLESDVAGEVDTDIGPAIHCMLPDGQPDPTCCLVDDVYIAAGAVLPGNTCEVCGPKVDQDHYPSAPDFTICGPVTNVKSDAYQHCIDGRCCTPNQRTYWDLFCGCGKSGGDYSNCGDEAHVESLAMDMTCADRCGGVCCSSPFDCPEERPDCAAAAGTTEFMSGWCVEKVEFPSCFADDQCPSPQKCVGLSGAEGSSLGCNRNGGPLTPGTCG